MNKFDGMSLEQIDAALAELGAQKDAIRAEMLMASAARDRKVAEAGALLKLAAMSDAEREALLKHAAMAQVIAPEGIASGEAVGEPGA